MQYSQRILPGIALGLLLAAGPAMGDNVDHYELSSAAMRANGQTVYPSGVVNPSLANPAGPPLENAVPMPPSPGLPVWSPGGPASPSNPSPVITGAGTVSPPTAAQTQIYPLPNAAPEVQVPAQASWYTRVEYYHWNERIGGTDFVNEDGTLFTLCYARRIVIERFRAEFFGGDLHYEGYDQTNMASMASNTGYLGLRGEYEMVLEPTAWEGRFALLLGLGSRFWIRDLHDGSDSQGNPVYGYQETWWTTYPFLGLETNQRLSNELSLYTQSRFGTTALTYQFVSINERPLWPKPGFFANTEIGLRGSRFFLAVRAELMTWAQSSVVQDSFQPQSVMWTAGGRLGFTF